MVLFLGAHTDDIELGCGGYIASTKKEIVGVTFTCHSAFRHLLPEMVSSFNILNIKYDANNRQDFKHRDIDRQALLDEMITLREKYKPEIVFTHSSFDKHQDHKVVHDESVRAFKHSKLLGYQLGWNDVYGSKYTFYRGVSDRAFNMKLDALACYKSQQDRTYFTDRYQESVMMVNGVESGNKLAEKFEVIRWVE